MAAPELRSQRLVLRHWRPEDKKIFAAMSADPQVMQYERPTLSSEQSDLLVEGIQLGLETRDFGFWAVQIFDDAGLGENSLVGFVGLSVLKWEASFTPCVQIGWRLSRQHWGFGYATEAAAKVLEYGFKDVGLNEIVSTTSLLNMRSIAVMERLGMVRDQTFDHPNIRINDPLRRHVLFRMSQQRWTHQGTSYLVR